MPSETMDYEPLIDIRYRSGGKLFNLRHLQALTKVKETVIRDFLFADDCSLNAGDEYEMQLQVDTFSSTCKNFSLSFSTKKTKAMFQPAPGNQYHEPQIQVNRQETKKLSHGTSRTRDILTQAQPPFSV